MRDAAAQLIHDMRNTATAIAGSSAIIRSHRDKLSEDALDSLCEMIDRRVKLLVHLLEDLRNVNEIERGDLRLACSLVPLAAAVQAALADVVPPDGVSVEVDVPTDAVALADALRVTQIIDNLLTNAFRYGGAAVQVRVEVEGEEVVLQAIDDGEGVPAEVEPALFETYVRGPRSVELGGTGLGMAIVRKLCGAMHGSVGYHRDDRTTFEVRLPRAPIAAVPPGRDFANDGHVALLWESDDDLVRAAATYAAQGLVAGEGVVVAATFQHRAGIEQALTARGIDAGRATAIDQFVPIDLPPEGATVSPALLTEIDSVFRAVVKRWSSLRAFAEIPGVPARLEDDVDPVERLWSDLHAVADFAQLSAYALGPGRRVETLGGGHSTVVML